MAAQLHLYIGRAGTGKTRAIHESIIQAMRARRRAYLFVPQQFTYEAERALVQQAGGLLGVQVLSVARLGERIVQRQDRPFFSMQGRRMIVRREAYRLKSALQVYKNVAMRPGFGEKMNELLSRLKQACITPEDLQSAADALDLFDPLKGKLSDIALLYGATQAYMDTHYIDLEDAHNALLAALPQSPIAGADLYFDGFEQVHNQLYALLAGMLHVSRSMHITLTMDPNPNARDNALFAPEAALYEKLMRLAEQAGCTVHTHTVEEVSRKEAALYHLERELYAYPHRVYRGTAEAIRIVGAGDRAQEVDTLLDAVERAARSGVRYRDMAVIASDLQAYTILVQRAFKRRDIPLFLDGRRSMQGHPVVELLLSAARIAQRGFSRTDLLRIAKSGLAGVAQADVEVFENVCLRRGFLGGDVFLSPFSEEEDSRAETVREALIPSLCALREAFEGKTAGEKTRALYAYLLRLDVQRQLREETERLHEEGRFALVEEHTQVWGVLMEMFEQLHAILGGEEMGKGEFYQVLDEALSAYQVGVIPATADQVLLGDIHRTRSRGVRVLFLIGCNEGLLPPPHAEDQMLDGGELAALEKLGYAVWAQEDSAKDRLAIYMALSKADRQLYLSFAYSTGTQELAPALLIDRVQSLFPGVKEEAAQTQPPLSEQAGFSYLLRHMQADTPLRHALEKYYLEQPHYQENTRRALTFAHTPHTPQTLGKPLARRLYGHTYCASVSRLSVFRLCPYRHFLEHGLALRERKEYQAKQSDVGSFAHMALERFVNEIARRGLQYAQITRAQCEALLEDILPACLEAYENGLLIANARARVLAQFYIRAVQQTAWALVQSIAAGDFLPVAAERRFSGAQGALHLHTDAGDALLSGVIDRIDEAQTPSGETLLRVVDYKTGRQDLRFEEIRDGLNLQLLIYLYAALAPGKKPAGFFYQPVQDPVVEEGKEESAADALRLRGYLEDGAHTLFATERALGAHSQVLSGLGKKKDDTLRQSAPVLTDAQMQSLLDFAVRRAGEVVAELLGGKVEARPLLRGQKSACAYCPYKSICRFDARMPACRVRTLQSVTKEEFFNGRQD